MPIFIEHVFEAVVLRPPVGMCRGDAGVKKAAEERRVVPREDGRLDEEQGKRAVGVPDAGGEEGEEGADVGDEVPCREVVEGVDMFFLVELLLYVVLRFVLCRSGKRSRRKCQCNAVVFHASEYVDPICIGVLRCCAK